MQHNKASSVGACAKEEANQSEWSPNIIKGRRGSKDARLKGEAKEIFSSLQAASNNGFSAVAR